MQCVLTMAGSDPCSGAGIQADLKTISSLGAYGLSVITAITVQNTRGVKSSHSLESKLVSAQFHALIEDIPVAAAKTGMLHNRAIIDQIASDWKNYAVRLDSGRNSLPLVVDPVMVSQSGNRLLELGAVTALKKSLLPLARVVTPNIAEAEVLCGCSIHTLEDMEKAGQQILETGCPWVVITGGHFPGECVDVVVSKDAIVHLEGKRINSPNNHGTGCTFSAALATFLGTGENELDAIRMAKSYVEKALRKGFSPGQGYGVLDHFFNR